MRWEKKQKQRNDFNVSRKYENQFWRTIFRASNMFGHFSVLVSMASHSTEIESGKKKKKQNENKRENFLRFNEFNQYHLPQISSIQNTSLSNYALTQNMAIMKTFVALILIHMILYAVRCAHIHMLLVLGSNDIVFTVQAIFKLVHIYLTNWVVCLIFNNYWLILTFFIYFFFHPT